MSKAVLISIRPKWVEKIASGEKTIEARKTKPKLDTPFKCYIYCTLPKYPHEDFIATDYPRPQFYGGGKVIGEFTCDRIYELAPLNHAPDDVEKQACLTREEIVNYLKGTGYGWHISDLLIYDRPRKLTMAEYKICFSVAGAFGAQIRFEAKPGVFYEDAAAALDKDKLAKLICLDTLGYSAKDIEIITPEQYEAEFGGDEDG